jgi:hypothetical protein
MRRRTIVSAGAVLMGLFLLLLQADVSSAVYFLMGTMR